MPPACASVVEFVAEDSNRVVPGKVDLRLFPPNLAVADDVEPERERRIQGRRPKEGLIPERDPGHFLTGLPVQQDCAGKLPLEAQGEGALASGVEAPKLNVDPVNLNLVDIHRRVGAAREEQD